MAMKHKPCAYCGRSDYPREKGHVFPRNIYPRDLDSRVQRRVVPECTQCKKIWQDAETQFRNIIAIAGEANEHVMELWEGAIRRSFQMGSGPRWVGDVAAQMVPVQTDGGLRHAVYPERDSHVMLVMRKIVRGLCHYHGLDTAISDRRVRVVVQRFEIPDEFKPDFTAFNMGEKFCRYSYVDLRGSELDLHSFWWIEFFGRTRFFGMVSACEDS